MQSTEQNGSGVIEIDTQHQVSLIFFTGDGEQVFSCSGDEGMLRRWRVSDGHEVGQAIRIGQKINTTALSPDCKWLICGLGPPKDVPSGASRVWNMEVWDVQIGKKVRNVGGYHGTGVSWIEISPDSTRFAAAGGSNKTAFIWSMTTGEKLVGSLQQSRESVEAACFSPTGDRIATATRSENTDNQAGNSSSEHRYSNSIRIYNSNDGQQLLDIPCSAQAWIPFGWSDDSRGLFVASSRKVRCFDTSSGIALRRWTTTESDGFITLSYNQKFIISSTSGSLSFLDTSAPKQIGTTIGDNSQVSSFALSSDDKFIATGDRNGRITIQNLYNVLPHLFLTVKVSNLPVQIVGLSDHDQLISMPRVLPLLHITDTIFKLWTKGDLNRVEGLLTEELVHSSDPFYHACTLANRALVRIRSGQRHIAAGDAKESIQVQQTVVGYIANAMACVGNDEHNSALTLFDLVFSDGFPTERNFLLLIKAVILFELGRCDDAVSLVDALINIADDKSLNVTVRAYMFLLLGGTSLRDGNNERAIELLERAREAIPFEKNSYLVVILLVFGWDFDNLALTIRLHLQECIKPIEAEGDAAVQSDNPEEAILQYSRTLTLDPLSPAHLLAKRSKARGMLWLLEDALKDADEAIKADPPNPWGYERRHAALHAMQRYDEAVDAFTRMFSLFEESIEPGIRQLGKNYVSPSRLEAAIESVVRGVFKICPPVLIDVKSGRLCDGPERLGIFKSESQFKELVSSMIEELDDDRTLRVVAKYFQYVMFSDIWEEKEASFQDVNMAASVWDLDSSPSNEKLKKFCRIVREDGYRWAWSDTCVDKAINAVLNQSLTMMYKWYEASAATLVLLASVPSPSSPGDLTNSIWMIQANTIQVAFAPKVIRFYDRDWEPYLGDTRTNHRESPQIMQELADALGITRETIISFDPDDLSVGEKLQLASTQNATVEEDMAYSLIGIFKSDIQPHYGEGDAALGHLLEEIVARSGDVTVLSWTGRSSPYNSCLPATLTVYNRPPCTFSAIEDAEMDERVAALRNLLSRTGATLIYDRVTRLPPARFTSRRLHLPSIIFAVKKLSVQESGNGQENCYRARVSGVGHVEFQTSDNLLTGPFKLIFVHPWIRDLRDPFDTFTLVHERDDDDDDESGSETEFESAPSSPLQAPISLIDDYTRALRLIVRLQQPFHGLLLQQQRNGQFKRVATEREIVLPGIELSTNFAKDIRTEVVEVL